MVRPAPICTPVAPSRAPFTRTALLSRYADLTLSVGGGAQTVYGNAIFSRVADLAVVDMLYMGIILSDYERFSRNLDRSGQVIADRGYAQT